MKSLHTAFSFAPPSILSLTIYDMTVPHALCTHSMVNGYLKNHTSNGKGGCTVKVYTCQRCEKCGYLANAVYQSTHTYVKCPH